MYTRRTFTAAALASLLVEPAHAEAYPTRPVTMVVPYAAGGPTDVAARLLAAKMKDPLNQTVVIENRTGGSTMIGAAYVARAPKDGYTIMMITPTTVATNPHLYKTINYKVEDFAPISMVVKVPFVLSVRSSLPVKTIQEFIAYAKAHPGQLNYGTSGSGSAPQLAAELFSAEAGIKMRDVSYRGSGPALTDLLAGVLDVVIDGVQTSAPYHREGKMRSLANFADTRSPQLPDVPTFVEAGLPGVVVYTWFALVAPAGTPAPVIATLNDAVVKSIASPDLKTRLDDLGFIAMSSSPKELGDYIRQEYELWGKVIARANIKLEQ